MLIHDATPVRGEVYGVAGVWSVTVVVCRAATNIENDPAIGWRDGQRLAQADRLDAKDSGVEAAATLYVDTPPRDNRACAESTQGI
jgi:hypothetical protein